MGQFEIDPQVLHHGAEAVDLAVPESEFSASGADAGHARLTETISLFASTAQLSWTRAQSSTSSIAERLRSTAELFDSADSDGASAADDLQVNVR